MDLTSSIEKTNYIGKTIGKRLKKIDLETIDDLLFYFPFKYENWTKITPISQLKPETKAHIVGKIELIQNKKSPKKRMNITEAIISDATGTAKIIWFKEYYCW